MTTPKNDYIHILGMAKSCIDLKGAKAQKVELDLLRILYAIEKLDEKTYGCLIVYDDKIKERVHTWIKKYQFDKNNHFEVITLSKKSDKDKLALQDEKKLNSSANLRHAIEAIPKENASGKIGEKLFEEALEKYIKEEFKIGEINKSNPPFGIKWDFYHKKETPAE
ncbi:hypothetical protein [Salibacter halophilus]|uniref:Uncharacterized protein n=1 Tax=Salibacter halophilus TaxID=1803916 RepID=A0A6N6M7Y7_9FLAO|nr:hypothetical protein [Salibacter halophilus]KAB1064768.1 hypothetical protein F3059_05270 [Salibacter halophilus]